MLSLIHLDWILNRWRLLRLLPMLTLMAVFSRGGTTPFLAFSFSLLFWVASLPLFPYLSPLSIEPFINALPVSRAQVVLARYLSAGLSLGLTFGLALALAWIWRRTGLNSAQLASLGDLALMIGLQALGLALCLALYLPFHFRFGGDRGLGLFCATFISVPVLLLVFLGWERLSRYGSLLLDRILDGGGAALLALLLAAGFTALSVALSVAAYRRRAF